MQTGNVTNANNRNASIVTSYRVAISGGKNRTFPYSTASTWAVYAGEPDIGTDGGVHNFLRYLETGAGIPPQLQGLAGEPVLRNLQHGVLQVLQHRVWASNPNITFSTWTLPVRGACRPEHQCSATWRA